MSLITSRLRQTLVRWTTNGFDNYGQPKLTAPVELPCRWVTSSQEFIDQQGTRQVSSAVVYTAASLTMGDLIRLGTLSDLASTTVPKDNTDVWEVRQIHNNPDFRNNETSHTAYL